ncbi:MAG: SMI1/KNR4 family protein [Planctomycetaceae bacterium]|nr:SMI1/KNR4 family protein [Planctomycetaceae bacterium]
MNSWREFIEAVYSARKNEGGLTSQPEFHSASTSHEIQETEGRLLFSFSKELKKLLMETNGVMEMLSVDDSEFFENQWLIWPVDMIQDENLEYQQQRQTDEAHSNRNQVLFFSSAGTDGILFGMRSCESTESPEVVAWYPIDNETVVVANSLSEFIDGWISGTISV